MPLVWTEVRTFMVIDIVRQAVQYKKKCSTESPLISEGEYCCACGEALRMLGDPDGLLEQVKTIATVKEVKDLVLPVFEKALEEASEKPEEKRLLHLLIHSRVIGEITDEIRVLFEA